MKRFNVFLFILLSFSLLNCRIRLQSGGDGAYFNQFASVGSDSERSDSDFFYIDLNKSHYKTSGTPEPLYEISTTEEYGDSDERSSVSNCELEHDPDNEDYEDPTEDIMCIMDIMEQDFYTGATSLAASSDQGRNLVLTYNVPSGMCSMVTISPSWHYNQKIGTGARYIFECEKETEAASEDESAETVSYACVSNISTTCPSVPRDGIDDDVYCSSTLDIADAQSCKVSIPGISVEAFNKEDIGLGNCCFGSYFDKEGQESSFEGDFNSCIGGPARHSWDLKGTLTYGNIEFEGVPAVAVIQVPEEGLRQDIAIKSLLGVTQTRSSIPITNYLEEFDVNAEDLKKVDREDTPQMFQYQIGKQGESSVFISPEPNPLWTFSCLDPAGDLVHRMHLMIREWNTYEEFIEFYEDGGNDDNDPDITGEEGDDCAYEDRELLGRTSPCNDFYDLEDFRDTKEYKKQLESEFERRGIKSSITDSFIESIDTDYPQIRYETGR